MASHRVFVFNPRTYITKSKAGHYTVTVKDLVSRLAVSAHYFESLEQARAEVPHLTSKLHAQVRFLDEAIAD
jgi:hypothetical protein